MGLQTGGHQTLAAGTGTFGYEPNVNYLLGFPRSIKPGGMVFDIPMVRINATDDGSADKLKQFTLQTALLSSALEHAVPEQLFVKAQNPGEAISAVKAQQKANTQGQRIYHITQANQAVVLPNIHHDPDTIDEIQNALNAGKEVITHADAVSVTGDGAYKIGGGANGGVINTENADTIFDILMALLEDANIAFAGLIAKIKTWIGYGKTVIDLLMNCSFEDLYFALPFYIWFAAVGSLISIIASAIITALTVAFLGIIIGVLIEGFIVGWAANALSERCKNGRS